MVLSSYAHQYDCMHKQTNHHWDMSTITIIIQDHHQENCQPLAALDWSDFRGIQLDS